MVLPGGRSEDDPDPAGRVLTRADVRVIPGGPAGDLQAAIEETVLAARRMRQEIEERIAKELDELF